MSYRKPSSLRCVALCAAFTLFACDDGGTPSDAGPDTRTNDDADTPVDSDFRGDPCLDRGRFIYLLDIGHQLVRLEPESLDLTPIGSLECDPSETPISMSIDREGVAWVLYSDGRIHHVSTRDASCSPADFEANQENFEVFGMGFVSLTEGSDAETLYVAGGPYADFVPGGTARLGQIDPTTLALTPIGPVPGWPELTGTGGGELWAFFPATTPPSVRLLNRESAESDRTIDLAELDISDVINWAFAFWGGRLHLFLQQRSDPSTSIWRLDPSTEELIEARTDIGYSIVGAGVSTCAPLVVN
jgi:hypothetical protein